MGALWAPCSPGSTQASASPPSSCIAGLVTNCSSWPCEEGEKGHLTPQCPCFPHQAALALGWAGVGGKHQESWGRRWYGVSPHYIILCVPHTLQGQPAWSSWTPWSVCSASCSPARRHRHRFCARPPSMAPLSLALLTTVAAPTTLCPGPEAEEEPCLLPGCDRK